MRRASALGVALALVLGLFCLCCTQRGREAGWQVLEGAPPASKYMGWKGFTVTSKEQKHMAKTAILSGKYTGSCILCWKFRAGTDQGPIQEMAVTIPGGPTGYVYFDHVDGTSFVYRLELTGLYPDPWPIMVSYVTATQPVSGFTEVRVPFSWEATGAKLEMTYTTTPFGAKANATHAKEGALSESWQAGGDVEVTFGTMTGTGPYTGTQLAYMIGPVSIDGDDLAAAGKYAAWYEEIKFCGEVVDLSECKARIVWGSGDSALWAEGTAGGTIGLWGGNNLTNYTGWNGGTLTAPLSYDFSSYAFKNMDGSDIDPAQKVYCTGIRTLDAEGQDVGPWHGSIAELRALGRYTQKHGLWRDN